MFDEMWWCCYDDDDDDAGDTAAAAADDDTGKVIEPWGGGRVHQLFELQADAPWKCCFKVPCYHIVSQITNHHVISYQCYLIKREELLESDIACPSVPTFLDVFVYLSFWSIYFCPNYMAYTLSHHINNHHISTTKWNITGNLIEREEFLESDIACTEGRTLILPVR